MRHALKIALAVLGASAALPLNAELQPEELGVEKLAEAMKPHWVWVNDISFDRMVDGRAYLIDGDSGQMLGMVSGGYGHGTVMLTPDGRKIAVPATFYSRGTRGDRTDVVTFYDIASLSPRAEAAIPAKRYNGIPFISASPVTPDGRFGLIYNFTPEQSVTVVDLSAEKAAGEYPTPGCGLLYPTAPRRFFLICSDGALQPASIDETGKITLGAASAKLFGDHDPVTEKGVWTGQYWLFFTAEGKVHVVDASKAVPRIARTWSLIGKDDGTWRPGAIQTAAYHAPTGRLYVLMHQGNRWTHKDPGTELWVYDAAKGTRVARLPLEVPATAVAISGDDKPLLYTTMLGDTDFRIYDAMSGKILRKVSGMGPTMTVIQPAPIAAGQQ